MLCCLQRDWWGAHGNLLNRLVALLVLAVQSAAESCGVCWVRLVKVLGTSYRAQPQSAVHLDAKVPSSCRATPCGATAAPRPLQQLRLGQQLRPLQHDQCSFQGEASDVTDAWFSPRAAWACQPGATHIVAVQHACDRLSPLCPQRHASLNAVSSRLAVAEGSKPGQAQEQDACHLQQEHDTCQHCNSSEVGAWAQGPCTLLQAVSGGSAFTYCTTAKSPKGCNSSAQASSCSATSSFTATSYTASSTTETHDQGCMCIVRTLSGPAAPMAASCTRPASHAPAFHSEAGSEGGVLCFSPGPAPQLPTPCLAQQQVVQAFDRALCQGQHEAVRHLALQVQEAAARRDAAEQLVRDLGITRIPDTPQYLQRAAGEEGQLGRGGQGVVLRAAINLAALGLCDEDESEMWQPVALKQLVGSGGVQLGHDGQDHFRDSLSAGPLPVSFGGWRPSCSVVDVVTGDGEQVREKQWDDVRQDSSYQQGVATGHVEQGRKQVLGSGWCAEAQALRVQLACIMRSHQLLQEVVSTCIACAVPHPGVAQLHGLVVDADDKVVGMLTELVEGLTLGDYLARFPATPAAHCAALFAAAAAALAHVHAHTPGLVHADIKAANIMVLCDPVTGELTPGECDVSTPFASAYEGEDGFQPAAWSSVKLLDFGVACVLGGGEGGFMHVGRRHGTDRHMDPSIMDHGVLTAASDVFSFGAMMVLELGRTSSRKLLELREEDEDESERSDGGVVQKSGGARSPKPPLALLESLVMRCIALDPAARPSAAQLAADLEALVYVL